MGTPYPTSGEIVVTQLVSLSAQPQGVPWPTQEWPTGPSRPRLDVVVGEAFTSENLTETFATIVVQGGWIVSERYAGALARFEGPPIPVEVGTTLTSWSMAKSMLMVRLGKTEAAHYPDLRAWIGRVLDALSE